MHTHLLSVLHTHLGPDYTLVLLEPFHTCSTHHDTVNGATAIGRTFDRVVGAIEGVVTKAFHAFVGRFLEKYCLFSHSIKYPGYEEIMKPRDQVYLLATKQKQLNMPFIHELFLMNPPLPSGWVVEPDPRSVQEEPHNGQPETGMSRGIFRTDHSTARVESTSTIDMVTPEMTLHLYDYQMADSPAPDNQLQTVKYRLDWAIPFQNSTGPDTMLLLGLFVLMAGVPWLLQVLSTKYPPT